MSARTDPPAKRARSTTTTAMRFPPELHEALRQAAEDRGLSINLLVIRAVEDFLPRLIPADEWRKLTRD